MIHERANEMIHVLMLYWRAAPENRLVMIASEPPHIVRKLGEASFELLIFTHIVSVVRDHHQGGIFDGIGAILLGSEHRRGFPLRQSP